MDKMDDLWKFFWESEEDEEASQTPCLSSSWHEVVSRQKSNLCQVKSTVSFIPPEFTASESSRSEVSLEKSASRSHLPLQPTKVDLINGMLPPHMHGCK